jgi:signal transduction histidine kinase
VREDPGAILLILRNLPPTSSAADFIRDVDQVALLNSAKRHLIENSRFPIPCFIDNTHDACQRISAVAHRYARTAAKLAERVRGVDPISAWVCGMLAPLGWMALAAIDPAKAQRCLDDAELSERPVHVQRSHWSLDQDAVARRLLRRWGVPGWVSAIVGRLEFSKEIVAGIGGDVRLFQTVQAAVSLVEQQGEGLNQGVAASVHEVSADLGLSANDLEAVKIDCALGRAARATNAAMRPPQADSLLPDYLRLAAENYQLRQNTALESLEQEYDQLHALLQGGRQEDSDRLRALKLEALAEFAAGAAHEINNPLAVISGQAQYLLGHEAETARQQSLHKIITQVQRVHQLLTELMQFARPARPQPQWIEPGMVARETVLSLHELAAQRQIRIEGLDMPDLPTIYVDPRQARTALECLVRNAIEAAGPGGWVRLGARTTPDVLEFIVEDSGPGPHPAHEPHLFDPFFSGRQAGRGRGLGLPTAWRLAQEQGGDVRHATAPGEPTRFVLALPTSAHPVDLKKPIPCPGTNPLPRIATA